MPGSRSDTRRAFGLMPLFLTAGLLACSGPTTPPSTGDASPSGRAPGSPPSRGATLRLPLFLDGAIVAVENGERTTIARWPTPAAPYQPPVVVPGGFVGLSGAGPDLSLSFVTRSGNRVLAPPPLTQDFGVSAGGKTVVVGRADLSRIRGSTRLLMLGGKGFGRVLARTTLPNAKGAAGDMIGTDVFVRTGDGGGTGLELWHTASGSITPLPAYTDAGPVDPSTGRVVLFHGDSGCWGIAMWPQRIRPPSDRQDGCVPGLAFSPDGAMLAGISGDVSDRASGGRRNRVVVFDASDTATVFTSPIIPGAVQVAWEGRSTLLVLSRGGGDEAVVTRCRVDHATCERVWSEPDTGGRYGVWLVVRPPAEGPA
jgi:hypothetical protein